MAGLFLAGQAWTDLPRHLAWDVASDSGYQAGGGIWNADPYWSSDGVDRNVWPGADHVAVFSAGTGSSGIQVNGSVSADSILFTGTGCTVAGGTIQMTGSKPFLVVDADVNLQSAISGAWTRSGAKTLFLSGNNSGTTSFTHAAGITFADNNAAFGSAAVRVEGPGRLVLGTGIEITNAATIASCSPGTGAGVLSPDSGASATWTGPLEVDADCTAGGAIAGANTATNTFTFAGPIRMGGAATRVRQEDGAVIYRGGGTASAFELAKGTAVLGAKNGLPPGATWSQSSASGASTLELDGFDQSFGALHSPANDQAKISNSKDGIATLSLTGSADSTYGGVVSGAIALEKTGKGRQILSGTNTFAGPTSVKAGTLCVTGSLSAQSAVAVDSGATLCGTGTVGGSIAAAGGTVAPGLPGSVGALAAGGLDLSGTKASTLRIRVAGTNKPGIQYDRLALTGNLVLGGTSILELDLSGLTTTGTASGIATAASVSGTFDTVVVRNAPKNMAAQVVYKSELVNVVLTSTGDPPSFAKGESRKSVEDAGPQSVAGWAGSISAGAGQTPGFRVSTDRPKMFSAGPSISSTGTLGWTTAPDSNGTAVVRIRLGASGNPDSSAIDSFTIQVAAVNDPPRFTKGASQVAGVGTGGATVSNWATAISSGPPDESGQKMAFRIATSKPSLYAQQPSLSADGTLRFTPSATATGTDTLFVRLGDDGGTADGGLDSSAIDTFAIVVRPRLEFRIQPDTLRLRGGATGRFAAVAKASDGKDSSISAASLSWSWSASLGAMDTGRVVAARKGTSRIEAQGFGMSDTAWLVVEDLDTSLASSTDSVELAAGHGISATVPPHKGSVRVAIAVVDSPLVGVGIAGADSAIVVRSDAPDSLLVVAPVSLVPSKVRASLGSPSVFRMDSTGSVHLVASTGTTDSTVVFPASGDQAYWLGYDTLAPVVSASLGSDSIESKSVDIDWSLRDNVAETGLWLCLLQAGRAVPRCSLLVRSDSARGSTSIGKASLPLGGMVWVEGRDSRDTTTSAKRDVVVKLDTIKSPWNRTEDRYEMLALPYVAGGGSAYQTFSAMWGEEDDRKWRAFGADSGTFVEVLSGEPMDAQGRGFWVRTRGANLSIWSFGHWTTPMSKPVSIHLDPGWNAVGNPLGFDVAWSKVLALSGLDSSAVIGPYSFDAPAQGWTIPDTTSVWSAWTGVALFLSGEKSVELLVPSLAADAVGGRVLSPKSAARTASSCGFRLSIAASQPGDTAPQVWIGIDGAGSSFPMPPLPSSGIRAVLLEADGGNRAYLSVARRTDDTNSVWNLRVSGLAPGVPLALDLRRRDEDTSRKVWIHDDKSGRWLSVAGRLEISTGSETERTFALRVGPAPGDARIVRTFGFENRGQLVSWTLPDEMGRVRVHIDAYDLRGGLLGRVVDEDLDPGSYARPLEVPSPIHQYLLVLRAGGRQKTLLRYWRR